MSIFSDAWNGITNFFDGVEKLYNEGVCLAIKANPVMWYQMVEGVKKARSAGVITNYDQCLSVVHNSKDLLEEFGVPSYVSQPIGECVCQEVFGESLSDAIARMIPAPHWREWKPLKQARINGDVGATHFVDQSGLDFTFGIDVYARSMDNHLWQIRWDGHGWSDWIPHDDGSALGCSPTVVSQGFNSRSLFATDLSGAVYQRDWSPEGWSGWNPLGGQIKGKIGVALLDQERVELYVRSMDDALFQNTWDNGSWSSWVPHMDGFKLGSSPAVVSMNPNHRGLYATDEHGNVFQKYWDGENWSTWSEMKAQIKGEIGAIVPIPNMVELYVRAMDDVLYQNTFNGDWGGWWPVDSSKVESSPVPLPWGAGVRHVFSNRQGQPGYKAWV